MAYYNQGIFKPKNPEKYIGTVLPIYRSSWELTIMNVFDNHQNVHQWASETFEIPYISPFDNKWHRYIPDFLVIYTDSSDNQHAEVIEVKPASQTFDDLAKSKKDKQALILNKAKWKYAVDWCNKQGVKFRIMTEEQIYQGSKK